MKAAGAKSARAFAGRIGRREATVGAWLRGDAEPWDGDKDALRALFQSVASAVPLQQAAAPAPPLPGKAAGVPAFPSEEARRFYVLGRLHAAREHHGREGVELEAAIAALGAPSLTFPSDADMERARELMRGAPEDAGSRDYADPLERRAKARG